LESAIGTLTANGSIIKNAGNDLQKAANGLGTSVNKISGKIDTTERDASDFSRKMAAFDPSKVEDTINDHASQLSKLVDRISSGSDNLSNINRNVERMLNKLLSEIESFNQLLQKQRKSLAEAQRTSSKNKSN
jgi:ABC-type transporter Mla subunit MlaD